MKYTYIVTFTVPLLVAALLLGAAAAADDAETIAKLDEALKAVPAFEQGGNAQPLQEIERIVFWLPPGAPLRGTIEQKLLDTLGSTTTCDGKAFLCRQLRVIGTAKCVPHLEKLLTDPDNSHMARYALGRLEVPEASAALHRALGKTSGKVQAGIINTLADRNCQEAKPDVLKLVASADPDVAKASARALGRLGGADSVDALKAARAKASGPLALEIDNALLNCAELFAAQGKPAEAAVIYEAFFRSGEPGQVKLAGLRGLVATRAEDAAGLLVEAIKGGDVGLERSAISLIAAVPGPKATEAFVGTLDALPAEGKVLLLRALGARGDRAVAKAVIAATKSPDEPVRIAALESLGGVGDASAIPVLAEAAATAAAAEKEMARASLLALRGDDVDQALIRAVAEGPATARVEAIGALAGRGTAAAVGELLKAAASDDESVRRAAIRALGALAAAGQLRPMIDLALKPKDPGDWPVVEEAIGKVLVRIEDKRGRAAPLLEVLQSAPAEAKPTFVRLLSKSGSPEALAADRTYVKDSDPAIREAAIRALADWPDLAARDDLLQVLSGAADAAQKQIALQGYVRMAEISDDPAGMYMQALGRVETPSDKKLVLAGLGLNSDSPAALELAMKYLDDKQLQATAGLAALRIASRLKGDDEKVARAALHKVLDVVKHEDVHQRAQEVLNDLDKYQGHILQWVGAGPYTQRGKDGAGVYAMPFPPESADAKDVKWEPITKGIGSWEINLEATYGGLDFCAAYLRTRVWSPVEQDALLELGSDDAVKVWFNGKLMFNQWGEGSVAPRQKRVPVRLVNGWNILMIKVVDQQGGWIAACRIRKPDGTALDGLKIQAE